MDELNIYITTKTLLLWKVRLPFRNILNFWTFININEMLLKVIFIFKTWNRVLMKKQDKLVLLNLK